ncbi:hypothetical protein QOZ88_02930 [Blastococcus sp. BMG 814]|uniref:Phage tail protein (Tail_P2_I) n=1 Tax=Blastococcus carthaginiensis TaxID=3050034 RepID=A0ABT9I7Q0_9ACTN|nr:hypothetical protein [Blastococcus carthaginiensis]MDP5181579.1 hypothetical protein [Blastococcus carthaginiensis]
MSGGTGAARQADALERLLALVPVHVRARDEASSEHLLRSLLAAVAGELAVLESDIEELYASWFAETAPEWVVPYLGDLVGVTDLPPGPLERGLGVGSAAAGSRRAVVANTVAYRRRKGTAAVLEQLARDATGWPARAVEQFRRLAVSTHVNHVRLDRTATVSLRSAGILELGTTGTARGALSSTAHTVEVRTAPSGRGRYGISNVGLFLFPLQVYEARDVPARAGSDGWSVHPLGHRTPLFAVPVPEDGVEQVAEEVHLPVPLRPRRLLHLLREARAGRLPGHELPLAVRVDEEQAALDPQRLRVHAHEDLAVVDEGEDAGRVLPGWQVVVDPVAGRLHPYLDGAPVDPRSLRVRFAYGDTADVGAGTYDRTDTHLAALAADPYRGDPDRGGRRVVAQLAVRADPNGNALGGALADMEASWAAPQQTVTGATSVVSVGDSGAYAGPLAVRLPAQTRLVVVAAAWPDTVRVDGTMAPPAPGVHHPDGLLPRLQGDLAVTGEAGSSLVLDGLVVDGDVVVGDGELGSLTLSSCTVSGRVRVEAGSRANRGLRVSLFRTVAGGVDLPPTVPALLLTDSRLDGRGQRCVVGAAAHLSAEGSTLRGDVEVRSLDASSCLLDGTVIVEHRQTGCLRFSYVGPGSRVPRRFRCVPPSESEPGPRPVYVSDDPGSPSCLALASSCPDVIAEGGEHGREMGVHHHLGRPQRAAAARRLLAPYVPVGLQLGFFGR